jgi:type I restriction enzyme S subunit
MTEMQRTSDLVSAGVLRVEDGNHGENRPRPHEFVDDGVPIIRAADMSSGLISFGTAGRIDPVARRRIRKGIGQPGDVLLTHKGTVGKVAVAPMNAPDFVCSPQTTFWRSLDQSRLHQGYLRYVLKSPVFVTQLSVLAAQTDMAPYVSLTDQRSIILPVPPIEEQRAIVELLGALDDKVAANMALATTVGALADALFAESVRGVAVSAETFADLAVVSGGGTPSTKSEEYWHGDVNWATPTDVTGLEAPYLESTSRRITRAGLAACASELHPTGSILMTSRATIGAFAIAQQPTAVNQGFIVVNANEPALQWWLFHEMRSRIDDFLTHANGATFLELSRGNFKRLSVRLASEAVMKNFAGRAEVLHRSARAAMVESSTLATMRDALLPQLMAGKIRVNDAEQMVGDVV